MIDTPTIEYTLSYVAGFIFLISLCLYIYLLIEDYRTKAFHTTEEYFWIGAYFIIIIVCFFFSYYFISKSNNRILRLQENFKKSHHVDFIGHNKKIPINTKVFNNY